MRRRARSRWVVAVIVVVAIAVGASLAFGPVLHRLAGASKHAPEDLERVLSPDARALVDATMTGLDPERLFDDHVHVGGLGLDGSGCRLHPDLLTWRHPVKHVQFLAYADAARIADPTLGDGQWIDRIVALVRGIPGHGRHALLAFDAHHDAGGSVVDAATQMMTPNDYVLGVARAHPDLFVAAMSVHPYRADAALEIERLARAGVRLMKWLPNTQGIDPSNPLCDAAYAALARFHVVLLSHAGTEHAVDSEGGQELGNPLRLRRALEHGVRVIVAHCASLGESLDLDDAARPPVESFDLFLRMMEEPRWRGLLFGEISAITQVNRCERPLRTLLERTDLHERLVNGSDYPLPAINVLFSTRKLVRLGYLTERERELLNEIYDVNPLLFDLATKRALKHPTTGVSFPSSVFMTRPELGF